MKFKKVMYIDVETTGLDPMKHDMFQLAGVVEIDGKTTERFEYFMRPSPHAEISDGALRATKMTIAKLQKFPPRENAFNKFYMLLNKYIEPYSYQDRIMLIGYNVSFDIEFLRRFMDMGCASRDNNLKFSNFFFNTGIDPLPMLRYLAAMGIIDMPPNFKQETVARMLGLIYDDAHNATSDIAVTRRIMEYINHGLKSGEFAKKYGDIYGEQQQLGL